MLLGVMIHSYWEAEDLLNRPSTWLHSVQCGLQISPKMPTSCGRYFIWLIFMQHLDTSDSYNIPITAMGSGK